MFELILIILGVIFSILIIIKCIIELNVLITIICLLSFLLVWYVFFKIASYFKKSKKFFDNQHKIVVGFIIITCIYLFYFIIVLVQKQPIDYTILGYPAIVILFSVNTITFWRKKKLKKQSET